MQLCIKNLKKRTIKMHQKNYLLQFENYIIKIILPLYLFNILIIK